MRRPAPVALISCTEALDAAFAGEPCDVVRADGLHRTMAMDLWTGGASAADVALLVEPCSGPTLDLGCGPGRLSEALQHRGVDVLGLDISAEAVRQARRRGVRAIRRDFFSDLGGDPDLTGPWSHVVVADGNIGLGGDPARLLRRTADLLAPDGTILVELAGPGSTAVHEGLHLRLGDRRSTAFAWATVGTDVIGTVAAAADLALVGICSQEGRHVATLQHQVTAPGR